MLYKCGVQNYNTVETKLVLWFFVLLQKAACGSTTGNAVRRLERDKSGKRKSNLNRALNSEEVLDESGMYSLFTILFSYY